MLEFLSTNKLCSEILSLDFDDKIDGFDSDIEYYEFVKSVKFHNFSEQFLSNIRSKISNYSEITDELLSYNFDFPFLHEDLANIKKLKILARNFPKFCIAFILNSYISWLILFTKDQNIDFLQILLKSLNFLMRSKYFNENYMIKVLSS